MTLFVNIVSQIGVDIFKAIWFALNRIWIESDCPFCVHSKMTNRDEVFTGNICTWLFHFDWWILWINELFFFRSFWIGEYFVSLKGSYKIPLKCFDANNPPPPGTEDDTIANNTVINTSPLAIAKRTTQPPDQVSPTRPVPPKPSAISQPSKSAAETTSSQPTKRSSLFSKIWFWLIQILI